ncbi:phage BR0599 family protein [Providencia rettgeri]
MSFEQFEYSAANGQPVTLYAFMRNETQGYFYTNADQVINVDDRVWQPLAISDNGVRAGDGGTLEILLPSVAEVAQLFRGVPPSAPIKVFVSRWHIQDERGDFRVIWSGHISEVRREQPDRTRLVTLGVASTFTRSGLRLTWGRACPYALYDPHCGVSPETHKMANVRVRALDGEGLTVTFPHTVETGYFSGGYIEWAQEGFTERRGLRVHQGQRLTLFGGTDGLAVGMSIAVFPGCDRTIKTCHAKFNNTLNYGGQPHMPGQSPYEIMKLF